MTRSGFQGCSSCCPCRYRFLPWFEFFRKLRQPRRASHLEGRAAIDPAFCVCPLHTTPLRGIFHQSTANTQHVHSYTASTTHTRTAGPTQGWLHFHRAQAGPPPTSTRVLRCMTKLASARERYGCKCVCVCTGTDSGTGNRPIRPGKKVSEAIAVPSSTYDHKSNALFSRNPPAINPSRSLQPFLCSP